MQARSERFHWSGLNFSGTARPLRHVIPHATNTSIDAWTALEAVLHLEASRIETGNLAKKAFAQLEAGGLEKRRLAALSEQLDDLLDDDEFWRFQAHSLAILATPDTIWTFRLANRLLATVEAADRFLLKPLMRAITFPNEAFVLALSENDARLIEVFPDLPAQRLNVPDL